MTSTAGGLSEAARAERISLPDLVIAGPGWDSGYGSEVRALIDEANRSIASTANCKLQTADSVPIHAVGMLSGAAKWGALYGCEAFVLPSHQENFGIAVVEALACGKPVLISNQINIWREIAEDGAGMVEEDTEGGVEKLLRQFLDARRAEGGDLRAEARSKPRECYLKRFAIGPAVASLSRALKED
jgi:glycosyltransferase involved in cell wall biosynthesis